MYYTNNMFHSSWVWCQAFTRRANEKDVFNLLSTELQRKARYPFHVFCPTPFCASYFTFHARCLSHSFVQCLHFSLCTMPYHQGTVAIDFEGINHLHQRERALKGPKPETFLLRPDLFACLSGLIESFQ